MAIFFGLVSSVIYLVSRSEYSSGMLPSCACWVIAFLIRIPTPPPFFVSVSCYPFVSFGVDLLVLVDFCFRYESYISLCCL